MQAKSAVVAVRSQIPPPPLLSPPTFSAPFPAPVFYFRALGCLLYKLVTLSHPYSSDNILRLAFKIVTVRACARLYPWGMDCGVR